MTWVIPRRTQGHQWKSLCRSSGSHATGELRPRAGRRSVQWMNSFRADCPSTLRANSAGFVAIGTRSRALRRDRTPSAPRAASSHDATHSEEPAQSAPILFPAVELDLVGPRAAFTSFEKRLEAQ